MKDVRPQSALRRWWVIGPPLIWLGVLFLAPFIMVLRLAFSEAATARPPYRPVLDWQNGWAGLRAFIDGLGIGNFATLWSEPLYLDALLTSLGVAAASTALLLLIGYPMALAMARAPLRWRGMLLALVILPFWTSFLIRVYAWIGILKPEGLLNSFLIWIGVISEPLQVINTPTAVLIGIAYAYLPFMVLPLYAGLEKLDPTLLEAAEDLGCAPWRAFWLITLPLTRSAALAGSLLVFIPVMGEFIIPDLLGGSDMLMLGRVIWNEFFSNRDWPLAAAVSLVLLLLLLVPIMIHREVEARQLDTATGRGAP